MNAAIPVATPAEGPEARKMAETPPARTSTDTDSKFTRNTKLWWQDKTGWTDDEYAYRRNAVYNKIREKWPEEKLLNGRDGKGAVVKQEIRDWLRPLVISFNDLNWPAGATRDRVERQLQPYISWALYLNRHPPTLNMPTVATLAHATTVASSVNTTPNLPSYSFVTPSSLTSSVLKLRAPTSTIQGDYWSQTSSDEDEPTTERTYEPPRKSQSVFTQSPSALHFDWDDTEVAVDVTVLNQDHIWIPMYDLKPAPKHSPAHWADFKIVELYSKISSELNTDIDQATYQFVFSNQPGNFAFRREGAYHIVLKRFSQLIPTDQVLRLRLEKIQTYRSSAAGPSRAVSGQKAALQAPQHSPALPKRLHEQIPQAARPIITSDVQPAMLSREQTPTSLQRSYEWAAERSHKRIKLPTQNAVPWPSASADTTESDTPPSANEFVAVNGAPTLDAITTAPQAIESGSNHPRQLSEGDARLVTFSESEASDQEMTGPDDLEKTKLSPKSIALIKMEGAS